MNMREDKGTDGKSEFFIIQSSMACDILKTRYKRRGRDYVCPESLTHIGKRQMDCPAILS